MFEIRPASRPKKPVYGVGINDADYVTTYVDANGKTVHCPYFAKWKSMLRRCYDPVYKAKRPTYEDCTVAPEWLTFSNFRKWMIQQDWVDKHLDKDLLVQGNKHYGPDTCVFVSGAINNLMCLRENRRGDLPLGVTKMGVNGCTYYVAACSMYGKQKRLGYFKTPEEAHAAYVVAKQAHIQELAGKEADPRIKKALLSLKVA
ncbi:MAG: hypothetical protein DI616_15880 [Paracoccus denitrificans]|uniref:AP2 domain-containing protein n=1 Tax=Paracoccus denitrificans TaxID=266 RepID=A0A533I0I2_PARDE|nr:MAG: hypothetical protein DI616_15880 [Paracoccus denitrificans]